MEAKLKRRKNARAALVRAALWACVLFTAGVFLLLVAFDLQAKPLGPIVFSQIEIDRPGRWMPAGQQVIGQLQHVGAIARTHQRLGGYFILGRNMQLTAAIGVTPAAATGAGVTLFHLSSTTSPPSAGPRPK